MRSSPASAAAALHLELGNILTDERGVIRARAREHLLRELRVFGVTLPPGVAPSNDAAPSSRAAQGEALGWRKRVTERLKAPGADRGLIYRAESRSHAGLERIAATEASDAWNDARELAIATLPPGAFVEVWDATLDRHTCDVCASLDGTRGPLGHAFAGHRPPVHPNCRCDTYIEPAP